jgi:DNA-binding beta-propeller fold protein YncE
MESHHLLPSDLATAPGTIVTVAGTGSPGFSGDSGPAPQARLHSPHGLALDAAGNLFIAELVNHRVRRVTADGTINTVAGSGQQGFSGDGGRATEAELNAPAWLVVDAGGNLFIGDLFNHRVRRVTPDGIISTYAGSGPVETNINLLELTPPEHGAFSGDYGPATEARLHTPHDLALDALGNLYIADWGNHRVRKVSLDGIITTVAGSSEMGGFSGDSGPAVDARLNGPVGLEVDGAGCLYVSDAFNHRVRRVTPEGVITTIAGTGEPGFSGDGGRATDARLNFPLGLAVDSAGTLFVADWENYRVRMVSPEGIISAVVGAGKKPYAGDGSLATETGLKGPSGLAIDPLGNLLIADAFFHGSDGLPDNDRVLKVFGAAAPGLLAGGHFPR